MPGIGPLGRALRVDLETMPGGCMMMRLCLQLEQEWLQHDDDDDEVDDDVPPFMERRHNEVTNSSKNITNLSLIARNRPTRHQPKSHGAAQRICSAVAW